MKVALPIEPPCQCFYTYTVQTFLNTLKYLLHQGSACTKAEQCVIVRIFTNIKNKEIVDSLWLAILAKLFESSGALWTWPLRAGPLRAWAAGPWAHGTAWRATWGTLKQQASQ